MLWMLLGAASKPYAEYIEFPHMEILPDDPRQGRHIAV